MIQIKSLMAGLSNGIILGEITTPDDKTKIGDLVAVNIHGFPDSFSTNIYQIISEIHSKYLGPQHWSHAFCITEKELAFRILKNPHQLLPTVIFMVLPRIRRAK